MSALSTDPAGDPVIAVRGLRRAYGDVEAVGGIDLTVRRGEVFALLGPNGAGKTTTVEILEGYRRRDGGDARVLGVDPASPDRAWRRRIGIVLQECEVQPELTVRESLAMYAGYYPAPRPVDETVALVGLDGSADVRAGRLSGGQRRRLDVALALIGDPELIFLDEPTTGFDPEARRAAWAMIGGLRELGKTIFLTTHYMEEADALADRAAVVVGGRIVAEGAPDELGGRDRARAVIRFRLPAGVASVDLRAVAGEAELHVDEGHATVKTGDPVATLHALTGWAVATGHDLADLSVGRPTLEDVYLALAGERDRGTPA